MSYEQIPDQATITATIDALKANGMNAQFVATAADAKAKVLEMIPTGSEVMTMSSQTLLETGIAQAINESGKFVSLHKQLYSLDRAKDGQRMQEIGAAPPITIGSVQAISAKGAVMIASMTGSQLGAYSYGAGKVIWVVGAQKLVTDLMQAMDRLEKYVLPLESERAHKAYGVPGSVIAKVLLVNKEITPGRIEVIIVGEKLGY